MYLVKIESGNYVWCVRCHWGKRCKSNEINILWGALSNVFHIKTLRKYWIHILGKRRKEINKMICKRRQLRERRWFCKCKVGFSFIFWTILLDNPKIMIELGKKSEDVYKLLSWNMKSQQWKHLQGKQVFLQKQSRIFIYFLNIFFLMNPNIIKLWEKSENDYKLFSWNKKSQQWKHLQGKQVFLQKQSRIFIYFLNNSSW
jgi:hypothetical protein